MKIIVAHPGTQHSLRLAKALDRAGYLKYYCTTVYNKKNSIKMKFLCLFLSKNNKNRAKNRKSNFLDDIKVVQFYENIGLLELAVLRIFKNKNYYYNLRNIKSDLFGIKVAKLAIKNDVDAVILYDTYELACFQELVKTKSKIIKIIDFSSASAPFMKEIYDNDFKITGNNELLLETRHLLDSKKIKNFFESIQVADFFIVPSEFVKESLTKYGVSTSKIIKVPYGANFTEINKTYIKKPHTEFLYVGQVSNRKGVHYLIEAFLRLNRDDVTLNIVGDYNEESPIYLDNYKRENIIFHGFLTKESVFSILNTADVFVLPSLSEGMSLAGLEALSCGLPIICTKNSGLSDIVKNGINGYIIPTCDSSALIEKMEWFLNNKQEIEIMGNEASASVSEYTWENYDKKIGDILLQRIKITNKKEMV